MVSLILAAPACSGGIPWEAQSDVLFISLGQIALERRHRGFIIYSWTQTFR